MEPSEQFCPNLACCARGQIGQGNIFIHDRKRQRYRCRTCKQTFSARRGTMLEGLRKPTELIIIVVTLLAYGCPIQAIVKAYGLDERTVASWRDRAGAQCQRVQEAVVQSGKLNLTHVQADEIRVKTRAGIMWMGLALLIESRLWLAGVVQQSRDRSLADRLLHQVRACAHSVSQVLVCVDGWAAYPKAIVRAFREKEKTTAGKGRCSLLVWPHLLIGQVIKKQRKHRTVEVKRTLLRGEESAALACLHSSQGGKQINTSFIERFNATMRERLAALTRRCRHASQRLEAVQWGMYLIGCTYNLCWIHQQLGQTPAMAARLTDHRWSVKEVLSYKVAPTIMKQARRPRAKSPTQPEPDASVLKRARGRPSQYLAILRRLQQERQRKAPHAV